LTQVKESALQAGGWTGVSPACEPQASKRHAPPPSKPLTRLGASQTAWSKPLLPPPHPRRRERPPDGSALKADHQREIERKEIRVRRALAQEKAKADVHPPLGGWRETPSRHEP
jgi:hypothetical protein